MVALASAIRARQWWEPKLAPILGSGYATAYLLHASILDVAGALTVTLVALVPGAAFVALLNDLTDASDDRAAGKRVVIAGIPRGRVLAGLSTCITCGIVIAALAWGEDPAALCCYAAAWACFVLYSVPPIRLKARGLFGALADAAGAHLFPHLLMVIVVFDDLGRSLRLAWMLAVGVWAIAAGLRSILCHQLDDVVADERSAAATFAVRHLRLTRVGGAWVLFPLELTAFVWMLVAADNALALGLVPAYASLELARARLWGVHVRAISPADNRSILMHDYYVVLYPLAFLFAATIRHHRDFVVLLVQLALFPHATSRMCLDVARATRRVASHAARRMNPRLEP